MMKTTRMLMKLRVVMSLSASITVFRQECCLFLSIFHCAQKSEQLLIFKSVLTCHRTFQYSNNGIPSIAFSGEKVVV